MEYTTDIKVASNGRMVLPKSAREALGVLAGGPVVLSIANGEVRLTSIRQSIQRAQDFYRRHVISGRSVDDFLDARKAEAAREPD